MAKSKFINRFNSLLKYSASAIFPENNSDYLPVNQECIIFRNKPFHRFLKYHQLVHKAKSKYDLQGLQQTYDLLKDEYSKNIFTRLTVSKLLGNIPQLFPRFYSDSLNKIEYLKNTIVEKNSFTVYSNKYPIQYDLYDLSSIGFPIKMYYSFDDVILDFILEQYRYKDIIKVEEGDYVINGGACYGNTALYFANLVGKTGKVFSFEFIDENIKLYNKNLSLNPQLKDRIELIKHPIDEISNKPIYAEKLGSASILTENNKASQIQYKTISIDDFVAKYNIKKIDFIKLDIEGSELSALKGTINTIKTFKPKLAICLYHKTEDLWQIPKFIKEILPEYDFYLDHFTLKK